MFALSRTLKSNPARAGGAKPPLRAAAPRIGVERLLQIAVATLVALGALLLGMGQRNMTLSLAAMSAAVVSIYMTDIRGWVRLNRAIANLTGLAAVSVSIASFLHATSEEQLLAVANLLVYLQVVLLFQVKTVRGYWQLLVLSVLQVVVGAALNLSVLFGVLLVAYLFVALAAIGLLFIVSEAQRWERLAKRLEGRVSTRQSAVGGGQLALGTDNRSAFGGTTDNWPDRAIRARAELPADPARRLLGKGILWRTLGIGLGSLVVAAVCFFSLPRFGRALWAPLTQQATIGYSPNVKLGDLGPLLQNPELVMRVDFRNESSGEPLVLAEPPLLRGSLVTCYQLGVWKHVQADRPTIRSLRGAPAGATGLVRQHIAIEPSEATPVLFCVYPLYEIDGGRPNKRLQFDVDRQQLTRMLDVQNEKFDFDLLTTGIVHGRQARFTPYRYELSPQQMRDLVQLPDGPPEGVAHSPNDAPVGQLDRLTGLREMAARKIRDAGLKPDDSFGKAKLLEQMLSSPPFVYSLNRPPVTPGVDPIEDFVTHNQRGHCEYFASALALMLRSQGIPARLVLGYRGGDWNPLGSFYDVRQLHAHAWVEAYLTREQIPNAELPPGAPPMRGAWMLLDPTPVVSVGDTFADGSLMANLADLGDYIQLLWNTYVVGMNAERQEKAIFKPLTTAGEALEQWWNDHPKALLQNLLAPIRRLLGRGDDKQSGDYLGWFVALALAIIVVIAVVLYRGLKRLTRWAWRSWRQRRIVARAIRRRPEVAFYRRFEALLAKRGLVRPVNQTQLEFARVAGSQLAGQTGALPAAALARRVVDSFYRVRFGQATLDSRQAEALELVLAEIEGLKTS